MRIIALIGICLLGVAVADDGAKLLAAKNVLNQHIVEGKDLTVTYTIYNVGSSVALKVILSDDSFPSSQFITISGSKEIHWDRIAPGSNVTHTLILEPKISGPFNFTAASITYVVVEGEEEPPQFGYTSAPGEGYINAFKDFDRKYAPHYMDWGAFAIMTLPSIVIPFLLWYRSKTKYDALSNKSKKN
ncbi:translocon-associated protein subunit beta-like [Anneissia japonica]|uniref:translocon-associated protein subunit beta-like n=1 Tax=Anneissia japonica TaxID=1529436 RepID=UPI00142564EB|nr:translocon-associated protein subunit beta-like [Anneissia japonica]XP_033108212.1 translocon-associated protein subunit beta-like [Anneissia japonica]